MAEEFTFANVRRAVTGIARYVASQKPQGARVIVGRDPRFLGETFCALAAEILEAHAITPLVVAEPAPTPAFAYAVIQTKADGVINFTASHNPPEYNGIKFSTPDGCPALPEVTKRIEAEIASADNAPDNAAPSANQHPEKARQTLDPKPMYLKRLAETVDLNVIRKAGTRVAFDPMWGAARGYSDTLLREAGVNVATVHDKRDVLFGGHAPEPDDQLLEDLRKKMRETGASIGIATDGDADRFGIVDADGTFLQPNYVIALLFDYLVESRGWKNGVAKSVATTNLINALAEARGVRSRKRLWDSSTSANSSCRIRSSSAAKRAPASPSVIMFQKKTASSPDSCAAKWWPNAAGWANNCARCVTKLVRSTRAAKTSA